MKYSDFHLYTVAKGKRFVDAAYRCAASFTRKNPGLKFTIFTFLGDDLPAIPDNGNIENILISNVRLPKYFTPAMLKKKPCADILFFKYADAPFMLEGDEKYIGQVDADCLCMCKLPIQYLEPYLSMGSLCAASDPKTEINRHEILGYYSMIFKLYFNSGICFWPRKSTAFFFKNYKSWVLNEIKRLSCISYADQTWLNIYLNLYGRDDLSEIGWYWNYRGTTRHNRAYIWHAGGRDSEGIEVLKKEFESWQK